MPDVVDLLCEQHERMRALLDLLEREVAAFARGEAFEPYVVEGVLDYVAVYPDRLHRPLELRLYEAMRRHRGADDPVSTQAAEAEHATLSAAARELRNAIVAVGRHASPPREFVAARAQRLLDGLRTHMRIEEEQVFPVARAALDEAEHAAILEAMRAIPHAPALREEEDAFTRLYATLVRQRDLGLTR